MEKMSLKQIMRQRRIDYGKLAKGRAQDANNKCIKKIVNDILVRNLNKGDQLELVLTEDSIWYMDFFGKWGGIDFRFYGRHVEGNLYDFGCEEIQGGYRGKITLCEYIQTPSVFSPERKKLVRRSCYDIRRILEVKLKTD